MKQSIQITQHFSFNVCNSIKYEKTEENMHFLRMIYPIRYLIYTFGALCQNMDLTDLKSVQNVYKIYHCVGQE